MTVPERDRERMEASPPERSPLDVLPGGGAADTPYPRFDVAAQDKWALDWDDKTRRLVRDRVENVPPYRFFSAEEAALLDAVCACLLPQDDRPAEARVPIAPWIDERLQRGAGDGYRYENMPPDREAYRVGLQGIDEIALIRHHARFVDLDADGRRSVIGELAGGEPVGVAWSQLPAPRFFTRLSNDVVTNYYAHPLAWAEMGFNGPASPRGHMRLSLGRRDPWEAAEERPRSSAEIVRRAEGGHGEGGDAATH